MHMSLFYFILINVPCIFYYFAQWPTNAQLIDKLSHSYMFRHCCVILGENVISTLPSYPSISSAVVGKNCVICQVTNYELHEDEAILSKHVVGFDNFSIIYAFLFPSY
jgi:hypothetical protein